MLIPSYSKIRYLSIITQIIALAKKDPTYLHKCSLNSTEKKTQRRTMFKCNKHRV